MVHIAFDLYGTILDTSSVIKTLELTYGNKAQNIASQWRRYQLEYTWRLNSLGVYENFEQVTNKALLHAIHETGENLPLAVAQNLKAAYNSLDTFSDVDQALKKLNAQASTQIHSVIFSNGTKKMVEASINGSASLKPHKDLFKDLILIDEIPQEMRKYKPSPNTYQYLIDRLKADRGSVWLVTSNTFDIDGGKRFGLKTCWIGRGSTWIDALGSEPDITCDNLEKGIEHIMDKQ